MVLGRLASFEVCEYGPPSFGIFCSHNCFGASHVSLTEVSTVPQITCYPPLSWAFAHAAELPSTSCPPHLPPSQPWEAFIVGSLLKIWPNSSMRSLFWHSVPCIILLGISKTMLSYCFISKCFLERLSDLELLGGRVHPIHCSFPRSCLPA